MSTGDERLTPVSEPDIVRATRAGKISAAALVVIAIGLLALFQFYLFPLLKTVAGVAATPNGLLIVKTIFVALGSLGVLCGLVMIWYGRKILRSGQCPPPDAWLARDTNVRRGQLSKRFGWAYIACGALACVLCLALAVFMATMLQPLARDGRQPVIILQQKYSGKP